jgi:hypothetical protein
MTTLTQQYTLGDPQVAGPLAVFPIFGPPPQLEYRVLADALELGAFVKELDSGAVVGSLLVSNPTDLPLLVYEGEEVLGAQQNRTFDVSVLVAAGSQVEVPVSCVERGRWDSTRFGERLVPAPHAADPSLRRAKRRTANAHAGAGLAARADQGEVWSLVDARLTAHEVESPSAAMNDVYEARGDALEAVLQPIELLDSQLGAVAQAGSSILAIDLVSRAEAFSTLLPRLARGYALDAINSAPTDPDSSAARDLLDHALSAQRAELPRLGLGRAFRFSTSRLLGSGVEHGPELVQLCAFPGHELRAGRPGTRIERPSRRGR